MRDLELSKSRVTVVIPTFNRANRISDAINSALLQTEKCQVIVVDHGSTDGTHEVVKEFGARVEYIHLETDFGPIFSWVDGVMRAQTEFVKILFDDDVLSPTYLSEALPMMRNDVGFVASNARMVSLDSGEVINDSLFGAFPETGVFRTSGMRGERFARQMVSPSAILMRRKDLLDGLYLGLLPFSQFEHHGAGPDHYIKLLAMVKYKYFGIINQPLVTFGAHPESITMKASEDEKQRQNLESVYDEVWVFYQKLKLMKYLRFPFRLINRAVRALESLVFRARKRK